MSRLSSLRLPAALLGVAALLVMTASAAAPALDFTMDSLDGESVDLKDEYAGKVVLFVNVASRCGFTPHYEGLQALYEEHKDDGLVVIGVPCNQFGGQEPGSAAEIAEFCQSKYGVTFPMMAKVDVKGPDAAPLYEYLTSNADPSGDVKWNFEKFVVGRDGTIAARFPSSTAPSDPLLVGTLERELAKKADPAK